MVIPAHHQFKAGCLWKLGCEELVSKIKIQYCRIEYRTCHADAWPNSDLFRCGKRNPYWQFGSWAVQDHSHSLPKVYNMLPFVLFACFVSFKTRKVLGTMAAGFVLGFQKGFICVWR